MTEVSERMQPLFDFVDGLSDREKVAAFEGFRFARDLELRDSMKGMFLVDAEGNKVPYTPPQFAFTKLR